jgi:thioredoxin reductase (NADPH)
VAEVRGNGHLDSISIHHLDTNTTEERKASALFVFIGAEPHTEWLNGTLCRDSKGFLITGSNLSRDGKRPAHWPLDRDPFLLETSIPGVFAVGDVRDGAVRRVANSVGEGSIVLYFVRQYLANR